MTIKVKLKLIQRLSGQSQEKLAAELGVSFPTLNSWINGRSIPREKAQARIDELCKRLTGEAVIPETALEAKKQFLREKQKSYPNILRLILERKDLRDEFVLALTYNTNRIEGSTLTEPETAAILFENAALPDKSIIEQMEVKNHQAALGQIFKHLVEKAPIDESLVLRLHSILMNGIRDDAGQYRNHSVRIAGSNVPTANYVKIPNLMSGLVEDIWQKLDDPMKHATQIHSRFEQIHPFSDGNGRVGRLILDAMLLKANLPPAVIRQENRRLYITYLNKSQLQEDFSLFEDFLCDAVLSAFAILEGK